eukprot:TRINITY_DN3390_c0_g1_i1.p5 TRINITY_DN3390_c0_g1~~TRINITY_DN3390_c0_g1_i1.p5  ORF type:complete len:117 (-),score=2.70 TRINITY_DN3390_c0_g1_i1:2230-2580(-)
MQTLLQTKIQTPAIQKGGQNISKIQSTTTSKKQQNQKHVMFFYHHQLKNDPPKKEQSRLDISKKILLYQLLHNQLLDTLISIHLKDMAQELQALINSSLQYLCFKEYQYYPHFCTV